jgi:hypothetical protein
MHHINQHPRLPLLRPHLALVNFAVAPQGHGTIIAGRFDRKQFQNNSLFCQPILADLLTPAAAFRYHAAFYTKVSHA